MERTDITNTNRSEWSGVRHSGRLRADMRLDFDRGYYEVAVHTWTDFGWQRIAAFTPNFRSDKWKVSRYHPTTIHEQSEEEVSSAIEADLDSLIEYGREFLAGL